MVRPWAERSPPLAFTPPAKVEVALIPCTSSAPPITVEVAEPVPVRKRFPEIESVAPGEVVPNQSRPLLSTMIALDEPKGALVVETRMMGAVEVPNMENVACGDVVPPRPRLPADVTMSTVVEALGPVEDAMAKNGVWESAGAPAMVRRAQGEEVPIPRSPCPAVLLRFRKFAESRVVAEE